jgi:hypothetical protein
LPDAGRTTERGLRRGPRHKTSDVAVAGKFHVGGLAVSKCGRLLEGPKSLVLSTTGWKRGLETGKEKFKTDRETTVIRFQLPPLYYFHICTRILERVRQADCGDLIGFPEMRSWASLATIA